jgi:hypothetical protein
LLKVMKCCRVALLELEAATEEDRKGRILVEIYMRSERPPMQGAGLTSPRVLVKVTWNAGHDIRCIYRGEDECSVFGHSWQQMSDICTQNMAHWSDLSLFGTSIFKFHGISLEALEVTSSRLQREGIVSRRIRRKTQGFA